MTKLNFSKWAVGAVLVALGAQAQASSCVNAARESLGQAAMVGNLCYEGSKKVSDGYIESAPDQKKAMSEFLTVVTMTGSHARFGQDEGSMNAMYAARAARKAYPGDVEVIQLVWRCSDGTYSKQVQFVGRSCEKVGPSFRYYFQEERASLQDMWY